MTERESSGHSFAAGGKAASAAVPEEKPEEKSGPQPALIVTTSVASDVRQDEGGEKIAARTRITDNTVETVIAADQTENTELLALHRALAEKAIDARKK